MRVAQIFNEISAGRTIKLQLDRVGFNSLRVQLLKKQNSTTKLMADLGMPKEDVYLQCRFSKETGLAQFRLAPTAERQGNVKQYTCTVL